MGDEVLLMWEKNGPEKRKIALAPPAPMGDVCFAGRETGAAGYVRERAHVRVFVSARGTALY